MKSLVKIGFGGGCHWCTEAVFQSLKGIYNVAQGWIASIDKNDAFSEAVIVTFNPLEIPLGILIKIHLHTHKSTSNHSMRTKYRSAIYYFETSQEVKIKDEVDKLQNEFDNFIITKILPFKTFKPSRKAITNYYYSNPKKPFCERFITPKLNMLLYRFSSYTDIKDVNL